MRPLGKTGLVVHPLCLGGNVFGWSADAAASFAVLDAYAAAGGNFVDTADVYSAWVEGHQGGESEALIGRWMRERNSRDRMVIATKVGMAPGREGLGAANIHRCARDSLERLGTGSIDLYYAHKDDPATPLEESMGAFAELVREGRVRHVALSNYSAERLQAAIDAARRHGLPIAALQPHYNLVHRDDYEQTLRPVLERERMACLPYFGLARGFLTGKYRPGQEVQSVRAKGASAYLHEKGLGVLAAVEEVAAAHRVMPAAVALAWLAAQPTVVAPIASARTPGQLEELLPMAELTLTPDELARLDAASSRPPAG